MKETITTYTQYNFWANTRLTDVVQKINSSLLDKEIKSSFPSLRKTMHHIWSAEEVWHKRLCGESPAFLPEPGNNFSLFREQLIARSKSFTDLVNTKDENYLRLPNFYKDTRGNSHTNPHWQMIMHCMNHSTYHRGQVVTILRELGVTAIPSTDMIAYFRETN
jgi:uncharacterized damage-inducible protein DinB